MGIVFLWGYRSREQKDVQNKKIRRLRGMLIVKVNMLVSHLGKNKTKFYSPETLVLIRKANREIWSWQHTLADLKKWGMIASDKKSRTLFDTIKRDMGNMHYYLSLSSEYLSFYPIISDEDTVDMAISRASCEVENSKRDLMKIVFGEILPEAKNNSDFQTLSRFYLNGAVELCFEAKKYKHREMLRTTKEDIVLFLELVQDDGLSREIFEKMKKL